MKRVTDEQRAAEVAALAEKLADAIEREAWAEVATYAGNLQRRAHLLAGLGRGG